MHDTDDSAKFHLNRSNHGRSIVISRFFKMAAVRHLGFLKVGNFNLRPVRRPNMRHHAKFIEDRSNHSGDMVIFDFARWRPPPYWIFDISNFELSKRSIGSICVILRNYIEIGQNHGRDMAIFPFF